MKSISLSVIMICRDGSLIIEKISRGSQDDHQTYFECFLYSGYILINRYYIFHIFCFSFAISHKCEKSHLGRRSNIQHSKCLSVPSEQSVLSLYNVLGVLSLRLQTLRFFVIPCENVQDKMLIKLKVGEKYEKNMKKI